MNDLTCHIPNYFLSFQWTHTHTHIDPTSEGRVAHMHTLTLILLVRGV